MLAPECYKCAIMHVFAGFGVGWVGVEALAGSWRLALALDRMSLNQPRHKWHMGECGRKEFWGKGISGQGEGRMGGRLGLGQHSRPHPNPYPWPEQPYMGRLDLSQQFHLHRSK